MHRTIKFSDQPKNYGSIFPCTKLHKQEAAMDFTKAYLYAGIMFWFVVISSYSHVTTNNAVSYHPCKSVSG